jgi:hypothetical protein
VGVGALGKKNLFDIGGGHAFAVIANAQLQPLSGRTNQEAQAASPWTGTEPVLHRILHQWLKREWRH